MFTEEHMKHFYFQEDWHDIHWISVKVVYFAVLNKNCSEGKGSFISNALLRLVLLMVGNSKGPVQGSISGWTKYSHKQD